MKILVLNCGSSSVKYKLFDIEKGEVMAQGGVEKIGLKDSFLKLTLPNGEKVVLEYDMPEHRSAIRNILNVLTSKEYGCIASYDEIDAVGHRLVHGGEKFNKSVLITKEVIDKVKECYDLAPLHNPANVTGVEAIEELLPSVPQVGVFDTAFHQTMPKHAFMYALPYEVYEKYGVRRYGFHGTSHRYVSRRACEFLGVPYEEQKIITCHIGNGASITAIKDGKSVDTSMGLTPVEGLMMGTRSGDVDAGALTYLMDKEHLDSAGVANLVNKKSGVMGISGISSDMRAYHKIRRLIHRSPQWCRHHRIYGRRRRKPGPHPRSGYQQPCLHGREDRQGTQRRTARQRVPHKHPRLDGEGSCHPHRRRADDCNRYTRHHYTPIRTISIMHTFGV